MPHWATSLGLVAPGVTTGGVRERCGQQRAVDAVQVALFKVWLGPAVAGREEPAHGLCGVSLGRRLLRMVAVAGCKAIEELEVVDQRQRLERKHGRDVAVVDLDQVVAVLLFTTEREIRRSAVDDGIGAVESADDELVVDLVVAADAWHLIERRRQL